MRFNRHSEIEGQHAFLSPSQYHWIRYSDEHLAERFVTSVAARNGSDKHDLAQRCITLELDSLLIS